MQISKFEKRVGMVDKVIYKITGCNTRLIDYINEHYDGFEDKYALDILNQLKESLSIDMYNKFIYKLCISLESASMSIKFLLMTKTSNELIGSFIIPNLKEEEITEIKNKYEIRYEKDLSYFKYRFGVLENFMHDLTERYVVEL